MIAPLDISGTRAFIAMRLRRMFFGISMCVIILVVASPGLWVLFTRQDPSPLLLSLVLLGFALLVIRSFIVHVLENIPPNSAPEGGIASILSSSLVARLYPRTAITAGDLFAAAVTTERGRFILREMGIEPATLVDRCRAEVDAMVELASFLESARVSAKELGEPCVDANVVLLLLFEHVPCCTSAMYEVDLSTEDLRGLLRWESFHEIRLHDPKFWEPISIIHSASLGRSWVMGYTDALDRLTTDVSEKASLARERTVVIHREQIQSIISVLTRSSQRNVLLVGKVGVGKRTLVENMAAALRQRERERHQPFTRVLQLKTQDLLSGTENPDSFFLQALNRAQSSGRFVLVIRDLALLLSSGSGTLKGVLQKFLEAKNISIIGIIDPAQYHALVKSNPVMDSQFEKILVDDASDEDTLSVLMAHYLTLDRRTEVSISYKALHAMLDLSRRYLAGSGFPGAAVEVMDSAVQHATEQGERIVREDHVREVVSLKGRVNVQRVSEGERERLLHLEEILCRKVIGQDAAVRAVANSLKRARLDLRVRKRPIGTFLFLGPTGVGKTQTAKVLAEEYFGDASAMIRLDMNEFSHPDSVFGIVGAASGASGSQEGFLAQRVQERPFSLILLDEIEKAHPSVLNLFLQILDEGFLTDNRGVRTDFRNTIIIATSNAGALFIRDYVKEHAALQQTEFKKALLEVIIREKIYAPEFINRFDEVVVFYPLSHEAAGQVAKLMLEEIVSDIRKQRGITVHIEEDVLQGLVERGYSIEFGAREMRRTITEMVEDYLADYLLRHDVRRGETIVIRRQDVKW